MDRNVGIATTKLALWKSAQAELVAPERRLGDAMTEYAQSRGDPPRELIIAVERKRAEVASLFEETISALDAASSLRTGHTNFGDLR